MQFFGYLSSLVCMIAFHCIFPVLVWCCLLYSFSVPFSFCCLHFVMFFCNFIHFHFSVLFAFCLVALCMIAFCCSFSFWGLCCFYLFTVSSCFCHGQSYFLSIPRAANLEGGAALVFICTLVKNCILLCLLYFIFLSGILLSFLFL